MRCAALGVLTGLCMAVAAPAGAQDVHHVPAPAAANDEASATLRLAGRGIGVAVPDCDPLAEGGDWIDDQERTYRRVVPPVCSWSLDDPPLFWWAPLLDQPQPVRYRLVVAREGEAAPLARVEVAHPYARLDHPLGGGAYRWWVEAMPATGAGQTSRVRRFAIDAAQARNTVVPDAAVVKASLVEATRGRPRLMPAGAAGQALRDAARDGERRAEFARVRASAAEFAARAPQATGADAGQWLAAVTVLGIAVQFTPDAEERAAWQGAGRQWLLAAAARPVGACGYDEDIAQAQTLLALARGIDLLDTTLSAHERAQVRNAAGEHLRVCTTGLLATEAFALSFAYRSHESYGLQSLIQALVLLAGTVPEADRRFEAYWDLYASAAHVWGVQDGSDGNGSGYGWANFNELPAAFLTLRNALGTDYFSQRAFFRNAGLRLVYFSPPVAPYAVQTPGLPPFASADSGPVNVFGDGASELSGSYWFMNDIDRAFRLYTTLVDAPLYRWYRAQGRRRYPALDQAQFRPAERALWLLAPLVPEAGAELPAGTPAFRAFADAGMVALHDDLADTRRSSLYFISSGFGAFSHANAEQNAFVLHLGGEPVLISAGYYDRYMSAHHAGYARRTRARNAITYDGGHGQAETADGLLLASMDFAGRLLNAYGGRVFDAATGDATAAYRVCLGRPVNPGCAPRRYQTPITSALRSVAQWRDPQAQAYFVYDRIEAQAPHVWEWNLHAYRRFDVVAEGPPFTVRAYSPSGRRSVCIDWYGPPADFTQTDAFAVAPAAPAGRGLYRPAQWHAVLRPRAPSAAASFLAVLRPQCARRDFAVVVDQTSGAATIDLGPEADAPADRPARRIVFDHGVVRTEGAVD